MENNSSSIAASMNSRNTHGSANSHTIQDPSDCSVETNVLNSGSNCQSCWVSAVRNGYSHYSFQFCAMFLCMIDLEKVKKLDSVQLFYCFTPMS